MSYSPTTDFLALLRQTSGGVAETRMPGLDYVMAALLRAGLFQLSIGQTAPTTNMPTTVWLKPSVPSWVAEGVVYLWNAAVGAYQVATPSLWLALLSSGSGYSFFSASGSINMIPAGISLVAVQRAAPTATAILLPNLASQWNTGRKLQLVDFSTAVANHVITVTTSDGSTIMQRSSWKFVSTPDQLTGVTFQPSPDLNSWIIAP